MSLFYERLPLSPEPKGRLTPKILRRALIGEKYWSATLDAIPDRMPYKDEVGGYILKLHTFTQMGHDESGFGLCLTGPLGSGKTALGCIILMEALKRGGRCLMFTFDDLVNRLWSKQAQYLPNGAPLQEGLENVHFLLLDDFRVEGTGAKDRAIEQVIRARYNRDLPTILATNEEWEQLLAERYLESMLNDRWWPVSVEGIDWRKRRFG